MHYWDIFGYGCMEIEKGIATAPRCREIGQGMVRLRYPQMQTDLVTESMASMVVVS